MRTSVFLERVRAECPGFAQVDHALTSSGQNAYPAGFVAPVKVVAEAAAFLGVHSQMTRQVFGVYIVLQRRQDADGDFGSADDLDDLRGQLLSAIRGWSPDPAMIAPFDYAGGELAEKDGLACWREDFATTIEMRLP